SHFEDPIQALRKMGSLLTPDGVLALEAGTLGGIQPFWYRWIGEVGFPQHRWLYSEKALPRLFDRAGLHIVAMQHFGLAPAVALHRSRVLAARVIRFMLRKRAGRSNCDANRQHSSHGIYELAEQFLRYRVGAIAPKIGPATWLIA